MCGLADPHTFVFVRVAWRNGWGTKRGFVRYSLATWIMLIEAFIVSICGDDVFDGLLFFRRSEVTSCGSEEKKGVWDDD